MAVIFAVPRLGRPERTAVARIEVLWRELGLDASRPTRWERPLRRELEARNVQQSNAIEGHVVSVDDALAAAEGRPLEAAEPDALAVQGYRRAMNFALVDSGPFDVGRILAIHFMMTEHDPTAWPGRWRPGAIQVTDQVQGVAVYEGPPAVRVPELMAALIDQLGEGNGPPLIRAAVAHFNLVKIHPFRDGNGRCSRALQTAVLGRAGITAPAFLSIEEYLGHHTHEYYAALAEAGGPYWQPDRSIIGWIRFCLRAHYVQAKLVARDRAEAAMMWEELEALRESAGLPERAGSMLFNAARGQRLDNAAYRDSTPEVNANLASRDLRAAVDAGLLVVQGSKRGTTYLAGPPLVAVRRAVQAGRTPITDDDLFSS
jgi:Fic family protein